MARRRPGAILIRSTLHRKGEELRLLTLFLFAFPLFLFAMPLRGALKRFDTGNPADVAPPLHGPIRHPAGGGTDVYAPYQ